jgi:hypothetical protein
MEEYRRRSIVLGREGHHSQRCKKLPVEAVGIDDDARLLVQLPDGANRLSCRERSAFASSGRPKEKKYVPLSYRKQPGSRRKRHCGAKTATATIWRQRDMSTCLPRTRRTMCRDSREMVQARTAFLSKGY